MIEPTQQEIVKLKRMLTDEDDWMRKNAAWVFGNSGAHAKEALQTLIGALEDEDAFVRIWAARALGEIGPDASGALTKLRELAEEDPYDGKFIMMKFPVRFIAREAIDHITDKP